jgi:hypothetical protein
VLSLKEARRYMKSAEGFEGITMEWPHAATAWMLQALCLAAVLLIELEADAGQPIYSYMDERGNLVATDRLEDIPERWRSRVKVTEGLGTVPYSNDRRSATPAGWVEQTVLALIDRLPPRVIPGLSTYQSVMLLGGFLAILLFYGGAKLTQSAFLRLLMPWAIAFAVLGTLYAMFVSDFSDTVAARSPDKSTGSLVHRFNQQGQSIGVKKQERLKRFDDMSRQ